MRTCLTILSVLTTPLMAADADRPATSASSAVRFRIEVSGALLTDAPAGRVLVTARGSNGQIDADYSGRLLLDGVKLGGNGWDREPYRMREGVLSLETDLAAGRKVYVVGNRIRVRHGAIEGAVDLRRIWSWLSLLPPLLAIFLAVCLRNVFVALLAGVWSGAVLLSFPHVLEGSFRTLDRFVLGELVQPGQTDKDHMLIVLFTIFLGALIGVMTHSGATTAFVNRLAKFTNSRRRGQILTWLLGLVVFFDDYANTLLVGTTMRPVADRLRISREKLAFLVDSTAAPIAGLAIVSTWVGFEIGQIADAFEGLQLPANAFAVFVATLPYRFYPILLVAFVWMIAFSGRDFGPMLAAERRAIAQGHVNRPDAGGIGIKEGVTGIVEPKRQLVRNALIPLGALLALVLVGLWWTGMMEVTATNLRRADRGEPVVAATFTSILQAAKGNWVLFIASFAASAVAVVSVIVTRTLTLQEAVEAWIDGAKSMFMALIILVLAWSIAAVCDQENLNTAGFLVELTDGSLSVRWMPTLAFLLSAGISFATGSSFSTMGLLIPLAISVTHYLLLPLNQLDPNHPLMLATIGAVLAGAIFGDHCSPISDTTVLSSAATGCDHLNHVTTQLPYACTVALVAVVVGYVPMGFGYSPYLSTALGLGVLYVLVRLLGRKAQA